MAIVERLCCLFLIVSGCWYQSADADRSNPQHIAFRPRIESLTIASWNLEWLADPAALDAAHFWSICRARGWPDTTIKAGLPYCDAYRAYGIESSADYARRKLMPLRKGLRALAARNVDVLAVEEVQKPSALAAVLPPGYRVACFTTRINAQNVGYAVRIASRLFVKCREIVGLSLERDRAIERPVRRGLELQLTVNGAHWSLLNVHLKAGCARGRLDDKSNDACMYLQHQAVPLEGWIETQAGAGRAFAVLGDWNRDLDAEINGRHPARSDGSDPAGPIDPDKVRNLYPEINDGTPAASAMHVARVDRSAAAGGRCHDVLDQLVLSDRLEALLDPGSLDNGRLRAKLVLGPAGASDHCALVAVLRMRR